MTDRLEISRRDFLNGILRQLDGALSEGGFEDSAYAYADGAIDAAHRAIEEQLAHA